MDEENKEQFCENNNDEQREEKTVNEQEGDRAETDVVKNDKNAVSEPITDIKTVKVCCVVFIAALLGSFFAMYFAADKYFSHRLLPKKMPHREVNEIFVPKFDNREFDAFEDLERRIKKEQNEFFNGNSIRPGARQNLKHYKADILPFSVSPVKIKTEKDDDKYNIIVSLKPFQNNPDKISYVFSENKITVFGKNEIEKENERTSVSFSQDFILPENADIEGTKRIKDGNKLIISIPVKE